MADDTLPLMKFGVVGVDIVSSPYASDSASLLAAQNVENIRIQGLGGLGSRGSLTPLNSVALAGEVLAFAPIPLPSPVDAPITVFFAFGGSGGLLESFDGGLTWTIVVLTGTPGSLPSFAPFGTPGIVVTPAMGFATTLVAYLGVPAGGHTPLYIYDPVLRTTITASVPGTATSIAGLLGNFYAAATTSGNGYNAGSFNGVAMTAPVSGAVSQITPAGAVSQIGEGWGTGANQFDNGILNSGAGVGGAPSGLATDGTLLYAVAGAYQGTVGTAGLFVTASTWFSLDPTAMTPTWTTILNGDANNTNTIGPGPASIGVPLASDPWATEFALSTAADNATIFDTTLQDSFPSADANTGISWFSAPILFNGAVFTAYVSAASVDANPDQLKIYTDGGSGDPASMTLDLNVLSAHLGGVYPGTPFISGGFLYWPFYGVPGNTANGYLLKRSTSGVWSTVSTGVSFTGAAFPASVAV
jgi:hypothetical protein